MRHYILGCILAFFFVNSYILLFQLFAIFYFQKKTNLLAIFKVQCRLTLCFEWTETTCDMWCQSRIRKQSCYLAEGIVQSLTVSCKGIKNDFPSSVVIYSSYKLKLLLMVAHTNPVALWRSSCRKVWWVIGELVPLR